MSAKAAAQRRAGVRLLDTADCYGPEISERLNVESLHPYPDGVVVSTKGGRLPLGNNEWRAHGRPEHLPEACELELTADEVGLLS